MKDPVAWSRWGHTIVLIKLWASEYHQKFCQSCKLKGHEHELYETIISVVGLAFNIYLFKHDKDQINTLNL